MEKNDVIASLLELPEFEPDRKTVKLPRLNLVLELQEVPYNKLVRIRREEDAQLHLILAAVVNHPELRQAEWYHDKEGCATPVDALKKLLRMGEVEKLCRVIDQLNGYGPGSVTVLSGPELEGAAIGAALEELEKTGQPRRSDRRPAAADGARRAPRDVPAPAPGGARPGLRDDD